MKLKEKSMKNKPYSRAVGSQGEIPLIEYVENDDIIITGYQGYKLTRDSIQIKKRATAIKYQLIRPYILPDLCGKSFVDLGCSSGAIGLQALLDGCEKVDFLDHDPEYISIVNKAIDHICVSKKSKTHCSKVGEFNGKYDVGFAFALIHWLYSYSEHFGSLRAVISALQNISGETLFIEWVHPSDSAIQEAGHIFRNAETQKEPYSFEEFQTALKQNFKSVHFVGKTSPTREIWIASNTPITCDSSILSESKLKINSLRSEQGILRRALRRIGRYLNG